jgi:hypothetical protein
VQLLPEDATAPAAKPQPPAQASGGDDVKALEAEIKQLQAKAPLLPRAMAVREAAKIADIKICIRGNHLNVGEVAPRGFLQVATRAGQVIRIPEKESGRRQLADWLASPDNPLAARVMANRVWHWLTGQGLVRTVDTFGSTGELPSHPELLDYLASRFIENGWSTKKLIREIVLSRAYQLSSDPQPEGLAADPENRLLWRMNRRRLDAEQIRDTLLVVSGKLDRAMGGPTTKPGASEYGYVFDDYRRSVYTPILRNRLHELFEAFDFPDPNLVGGRRNVSTVATQALYLMNSPFVIEQARFAAQRSLGMPLEDAARIDQAYRTALGRAPTVKEQQLTLQFISAADAKARPAAWERFYQALFASVDFRYVN